MKTITKNGMTVSWHYQEERICFEMSAPTKGWLTIGFNDSADIVGAYLLMGHVVDKKADVVEHYTISPGNYKAIQTLGGNPSVKHVEGWEEKQYCKIKFSLPITTKSNYKKDLSKDKKYYMMIAYSQEDDFQHHSIMRTSISVQL